MKLRPGPVAAVLLLAGLGGWVYFSEFKGADERRKSDETKDKPLLVDRADLKAIVIRNQQAEIRLMHDGDTWSLAAPLQGPTDKEAIEGVLSSLETGHIERRLGEVTDRKGFGLDPPATGVTLESLSGKPAQTIELGDANPIGGTIYALLPGGKEVAVVSGTLGEVGKKGLQELRDKSLIAFDPWKVNSLTLEHEHEPEHGHGRAHEHEKVELKKPAAGWRLTSPIEAPGDGPTITDLLSAVERLRATRFVVEKGTPEDEKKYGLDPPVARMALAQEGKEGTQTLLFGRQEGTERYARVVGHDPIVAIPGEIFSKVTTGLFDLRRKEALGVSQFRVQSLSVAKDGGEALVLTRQKDGSWLATGLAKGPVKGDTVDALLRAVGGLKTTAFDDHPAAAATAALVSHPALDLTLEEEPETEGAAPRRQHLVLGRPGKNGRMAMRDLAWPSVAEVAADGVAPITSQLDVVVKEATTPAPAPAAGTPAPSGTPPAIPPPS